MRFSDDSIVLILFWENWNSWITTELNPWTLIWRTYGTPISPRPTYVYIRGRQKSNETDFLFTKVLFFKHQCYPLQNSSLGQPHSHGDVLPTFGMVFSTSVALFCMFSKVPNWRPLSIFLSLGKKKKSQKLRSGEGGWGTTGMPFEVKNSVTGEGSVTWDVVMMDHPFACKVRSLANGPFSKPFKDVLIKKLVTSVTDILKTIPVEDFQRCNQQWEERLHRWVCSCPRELCWSTFIMSINQHLLIAANHYIAS